jgi:hypothetical protein
MKQFENIMETHTVYLYMLKICVPLVTLQTSTRYSNYSHVRRNYDSSTLAVASEIRCRGDCRAGFTCPHRRKRHGVLSGYVCVCVGGGGEERVLLVLSTCLLHLRRHVPLTVIAAQLVATLQSMFPTKT